MKIQSALLVLLLLPAVSAQFGLRQENVRPQFTKLPMVDCSRVNTKFIPSSWLWCATATPSVSPTSSVSTSPTISPTASATPSPSTSTLPTQTPSASPSSSGSPRMSQPTKEPSIPSTSNTPVSSITPSNSGALSPSVNPLLSITPSSSPTITTSVTPSYSPTSTSSYTPAPSVTPSSSSTPSISPSPSLTPSTTPTTSITPTTSPSPSFCEPSFNQGDWTYSIPHTFDSNVHNSQCSTPFPLGTYTGTEASSACYSSLILTGAATTREVSARLIELKAVGDIQDLSEYSISVGEPLNGQPNTPEFVLSGSVSSGQFLYITNTVANIETFFDITTDLVTDVADIRSGTQVIYLFRGNKVVDQIGTIDISSHAWGYFHSWAYRNA